MRFFIQRSSPSGQIVRVTALERGRVDLSFSGDDGEVSRRMTAEEAIELADCLREVAAEHQALS